MNIISIWQSSIPYKKFWRSYFYMLIHPKRSLRLINFAIKVLIYYGVPYELVNDERYREK